MTQLKDPGKDKGNRKDRKDATLKAWKRPSSKKDRDKAREERIKAWGGDVCQ